MPKCAHRVSSSNTPYERCIHTRGVSILPKAEQEEGQDKWWGATPATCRNLGRPNRHRGPRPRAGRGEEEDPQEPVAADRDLRGPCARRAFPTQCGWGPPQFDARIERQLGRAKRGRAGAAALQEQRSTLLFGSLRTQWKSRSRGLPTSGEKSGCPQHGG